MSSQDKWRHFEDHVAELVDRSAPRELLEQIADDDELRDARHEALGTARLLAHAADDFTLEPTDPIGDDSSPPLPGARQPDACSASRTEDAPTKPSEAHGSSGPSPEADAAPTPKPEEPRAPSAARSHLAVWVALGVAAAFGLVVAVWGTSPKKTLGTRAKPTLEGKVARVDLLSDAGRVELCDRDQKRCTGAARGARVEAGKSLRTNDFARATLVVDEGTEIGLGRATTLAFDPERGARLVAGEAIVNVDRARTDRLSVELAHGSAELDRAKCALYIDPQEEGRIEVIRGRVHVTSDTGEGASVFAGEAARIRRDGALTVGASRVAGDAIADDGTSSERAEEGQLAPGLGELRAKKPGESNERVGAVRLQQHRVRARIVGPMAKTEVEEVFVNDTNDVLEGIFRFPLPSDAQIERLALEVDGKLVEGAFVDRERASAIWRGSIVQAAPQLRQQIRDEIIWVPGPWRDPALLEWQRGNRFELRIYPIPKRGSRRIVLSYTQVVPAAAGARHYSYPLPSTAGAQPGIDGFSFELEMRGHDPARGPAVMGYRARFTGDRDVARFRMEEQRFRPRGELVVNYELPSDQKDLIAWGYRSENANESPTLAMLLRPRLARPSEPPERSYAFVVDTSRSMVGESLRRASELSVRIIRELPDDAQVVVLACDSDCRIWPDGVARAGQSAAQSAQRWLREQTADGASNLAQSLELALDALPSRPGVTRQVVYVGDGTPTVGPSRPGTLARAVRRRFDGVASNVTAIAVGIDSDLDSLRAMARGGSGIVIPYTPGTSIGRAAYSAIAALSAPRLTNVRLELPEGISAVAPATVDTIAAGDELLIVGRMGARLAGDVVLRGSVQGQPFEQRYPLDVEPVGGESNAFVPRLFAAARLSELERRGDATAKSEAIELSRRYSVASRYTSLLVLESQVMFDAFGLDNRRRAAQWTGNLEDSAATAQAADDETSGDETSPSDIGVSPAGATATGSSSFGAGKMRPLAEPSPARKAAAAAPAPAAAPKPSFPPFKEEQDLTRPSLSTAPMEAEWDRPRRRVPPMIPMRRIWERKGEILPDRLPNASAQVAAAERAHEQNQDSRDATKKLFDLYARLGELDRAAAVADSWCQRDPLDADALIARADVAARRGDRRLAIRILGSVVDVRPSDYGAQQRLSRLHRWQGDSRRACDFSIALAEFRPKDEKALAEALRCLQENKGSELASELRQLAPEPVLRAAEQLLGKPRAEDRLSGDLRIKADWRSDDGADLDLALIDPDGHRVSWLGAPTRAVITAMYVTSENEEGLAMRGAKPGEYVLEITRANGSSRVEGKLNLHVAGTERQLPFVIDGRQKMLGLVRITMVPKLVPLPSGAAFRMAE